MGAFGALDPSSNLGRAIIYERKNKHDKDRKSMKEITNLVVFDIMVGRRENISREIIILDGDIN